MLLKQFTRYSLDEDAAVAVRHNLFRDLDESLDVFDAAVPVAIEDDSASRSSGFAPPSPEMVENAVNAEVIVTHRFYKLTHLVREKVVDAAGIRTRCEYECENEMGPIALEEEFERRIDVAFQIAPIDEKYTPVYLSGDGEILVGAVGSHAETVMRDLMRHLCSLPDKEGEFKVRGNYIPHSRHFVNKQHFNKRCFDLVDECVWGLEIGEDTKNPFHHIEFGGDFKVKLQDQATMAVKHCGMLPEELRPFFQAAEYTSISLKVETRDIEYSMTITPKGEIKSFKLLGPVSDDTDDLDIGNHWLCFQEMLFIYDLVVDAFGKPMDLDEE